MDREKFSMLEGLAREKAIEVMKLDREAIRRAEVMLGFIYRIEGENALIHVENADGSISVNRNISVADLRKYEFIGDTDVIAAVSYVTCDSVYGGFIKLEVPQNEEAEKDVEFVPGLDYTKFERSRR